MLNYLFRERNNRIRIWKKKKIKRKNIINNYYKLLYFMIFVFLKLSI